MQRTASSVPFPSLFATLSLYRSTFLSLFRPLLTVSPSPSLSSDGQCSVSRRCEILSASFERKRPSNWILPAGCFGKFPAINERTLAFPAFHTRVLALSLFFSYLHLIIVRSCDSYTSVRTKLPADSCESRLAPLRSWFSREIRGTLVARGTQSEAQNESGFSAVGKMSDASADAIG